MTTNERCVCADDPPMTLTCPVHQVGAKTPAEVLRMLPLRAVHVEGTESFHRIVTAKNHFVASCVNAREAEAFVALCNGYDALQSQNAELRRENDFMRAHTGNSATSCVYCGLGANEQGKCASGFPGCARRRSDAMPRGVCCDGARRVEGGAAQAHR